MPDNIDPKKKAAIIAAIAASMGKSRPGMFLRDCKDSGAWGKLSRVPVTGAFKADSRRRKPCVASR